MLSLPFSSHFFVATSNELGLRKRTVSDSQLSASSSLDDNEAPGRPEHAFFDNNQGSWCSYTNGANEWLELDLGTDQTIYGVAVQGSHDSNAEVTLYKIGMRLDGSLGDSWLHEVVSNSHLLVLEGVKDSISSMSFSFETKKLTSLSLFVDLEWIFELLLSKQLHCTLCAIHSDTRKNGLLHESGRIKRLVTRTRLSLHAFINN